VDNLLFSVKKEIYLLLIKTVLNLNKEIYLENGFIVIFGKLQMEKRNSPKIRMQRKKLIIYSHSIVKIKRKEK